MNMIEQAIQTVAAEEVRVESTLASFRWEREDKDAALLGYMQSLADGGSHRKSADSAGIPESTARYWTRMAPLDVAPELAEFLQSRAGMSFLERMVNGLVLMFVLRSGVGLRVLSTFLKLTHLDRFVGASYSSLRRHTTRMEEEILKYEKEETRRLSQEMPHRDITVALDEHFHGGLTLVGVDPVSGYVLHEGRSERRDEAAWSEAMTSALSELRVNVIQGTSDEAKGILKYTEDTLNAHHSPDLFHIVREPCKAVCRHAGRVVEEARNTLKEAAIELEKHESLKGRDRTFEMLQTGVEAKHRELVRVEALQERASEEIRGIGEDYHFADLSTGIRSSKETIARRIHLRLDAIEQIASELDAPARSFDHIKKARRLVPQMKATIGFVGSYVHKAIDALRLPEEQERAVKQRLVGAEYIERIARSTVSKDARTSLFESAEKIKSELFAKDGQLHDMTDDKRLEVMAKARELANVFQRSSSCVEGRNGALAFRHHQLRDVPPQRRKIMTVLHNFLSERADETGRMTTAAERFFGGKPRNLFDVIAERMKPPPLPKSPPRRTCESSSLHVH